MTGKEMRAYILNNGCNLWQVAYALGITDSYFSRKLRKDFDEEETNKIVEIVKQIKKAQQ